MKRKTVGFLMLACMGVVLAGYCVNTGSLQSECVQEENPRGMETFAESSDVKTPSANTEGISVLEEEEEEKEPGHETGSSETVQSEIIETEERSPKITDLERQEVCEPQIAKEPQKKESEAQEAHPEKDFTGQDPPKADIREPHSLSDIPPKDTVVFTPSRKEEIMEDRYIESVVDENDPDTYQIVKKKEVIPTLYVNNVGDIKYAYEDGIWYEYKYSNVNITLDTKDEKLALFILSLDGSYDEYEVLHTDCAEIMKEDGSMEYEFHVRYQGIFAMEGTPVDVENLKPGDPGRVAATRVVVTEEKVPVMQQKLVGTGEYRYFGWQVLDGDTYYFDHNGNKVTGSQVIQGIRHEFDENGVRISRAGVKISEENGEIDWKQVSDMSLDFAVIPCVYSNGGEGRLVIDSYAKKNISDAQAAGVEVLPVLLLQAATPEDAVEEAKAVISLAEKYDLTAPIAVADAATFSGESIGMDVQEMPIPTACVDAFCRTVKENGYTPMLYVEASQLENGFIMEELMENPLWVAEYNENLTYTGTCSFWQYTARGAVNGISGYTGLIISYENRRDFR